jgi:hypothetical protein
MEVIPQSNPLDFNMAKHRQRSKNKDKKPKKPFRYYSPDKTPNIPGIDPRLVGKPKSQRDNYNWSSIAKNPKDQKPAKLRPLPPSLKPSKSRESSQKTKRKIFPKSPHPEELVASRLHPSTKGRSKTPNMPKRDFEDKFKNDENFQNLQASLNNYINELKEERMKVRGYEREIEGRKEKERKLEQDLKNLQRIFKELSLERCSVVRELERVAKDFGGVYDGDKKTLVTNGEISLHKVNKQFLITKIPL